MSDKTQKTGDNSRLTRLYPIAKTYDQRQAELQQLGEKRRTLPRGWMWRTSLQGTSVFVFVALLLQFAEFMWLKLGTSPGALLWFLGGIVLVYAVFVYIKKLSDAFYRYGGRGEVFWTIYLVSLSVILVVLGAGYTGNLSSVASIVAAGLIHFALVLICLKMTIAKKPT